MVTSEKTNILKEKDIWTIASLLVELILNYSILNLGIWIARGSHRVGLYWSDLAAAAAASEKLLKVYFLTGRKETVADKSLFSTNWIDSLGYTFITILGLI